MVISIADRLALTRNRPAGFDWMRILLACSIVAWHSIVTAYGKEFQDTLWTNPVLHPLLVLLLGMFFALSGFLVAGSLERCRTVVSFVGLRVMRIFPALVVETLLSALILGPLLTNVTWSDYFSSPDFRNYLLNTLGIVHFVLPGVFTDNPVPNLVNGQLWTVPYELRCYEALVVISLLNMYTRKWLLTAAIGLLMFLLAAKAYLTSNYMPFSLTGNQLLASFLCGVMLFRFRTSIPWAAWLVALSAIAALVLLSFTGGADFAPLPIAYLTVYLGLLNPRRAPVIFSGDYSYGLFLYGFPIQQAIVSSGPWAHHWYATFGLAFPLTAMVAVGSWWLIEKPVLSRKKGLIWLEDKAIELAGSLRRWWIARKGGQPVFNPSAVAPADNREG